MIEKIKHIASYLYPLVVEQCEGKVSPYLEVNLVNGKYTLDTSKVNYSYGSLYKIFDQTFHKFKLKKRVVKNILILGFGAGCVVSLLREKYNIKAEITGVEKDSVVITLAHKYFNINRFKNLNLICEDAHTFVKKCSQKFDVIVIDLFVDEQVPKCFQEKEFLRQLDKLLLNRGILFFNIIVNNSIQRAEFKELTANMEEVFGNGLTYKVTKNGVDNNVLIHDRRTAIVNNSFVMNPDKKLYTNRWFAPSLHYIKKSKLKGINSPNRCPNTFSRRFCGCFCFDWFYLFGETNYINYLCGFCGCLAQSGVRRI